MVVDWRPGMQIPIALFRDSRRFLDSIATVLIARALWTAVCGNVAVLLTLVPPAYAAATLKGLVVLDRERGQPSAGVVVSADGANPSTTDSDGRFVLTFPNHHPGEDVRVIVRRPGWDVVNDLLLQQRLPHNPEARPLEIIICKAAERERWALEFYRLKGTQVVDLQYRQQLAELERRRAATAGERDRLKRERDQALRQADELARQLAAREAVTGAYP